MFVAANGTSGFCQDQATALACTTGGHLTGHALQTYCKLCYTLRHSVKLEGPRQSLVMVRKPTGRLLDANVKVSLEISMSLGLYAYLELFDITIGKQAGMQP